MLKEIGKDKLLQLIGSRASVVEQETSYINDLIINERISLKLDYEFVRNVYAKTIIFNSCAFKKEIITGEFRYTGMVQFVDCTFEGDAIFESQKNIKLVGKNVFLNDLTLSLDTSSEFTTPDICVSGKLNITGNARKIILQSLNNDSPSEKAVIDIDCGCPEIEIADCFGLEDILFNVKEYATNIKIQNIGCKNLKFNNSYQYGKIQIENSEIYEIDFSKMAKTAEQLLCHWDNKIVMLRLSLSSFQEAIILDCDVSNLLFSGENKTDAIVNVEKIYCRHLSFQKIFNKGNFSLREIRLEYEGVISMLSSNMGKMDFVLCDFSKANLGFENSKISEVFFSHTDFPKKVYKDLTDVFFSKTESPEKFFRNRKESASQGQLAFGQLSNAFQKQGDTVRQLEFQSREIEAHYKTLTWNSAHFFVKLNLFLNNVSNKFGRRWVQGIFFTFSVGLSFFCLLLITTDEYTIGFPTINYKLIPSFFIFVNPLRTPELQELFKTSNSLPLTLTVSSYIVDFLGRILVAFGYYQTIQAFRRYGRK
jgi:hypothetical protein